MALIIKNGCKGHLKCERDAIDGLCIFHLPADDQNKIDCDQFDIQLSKEIMTATPNDKGLYEIHWEGIIFPNNHVLFETLMFTEKNNRLPNCWINLADAHIQSILAGVSGLDTLILTNATIHKDTSIGVMEIDNLYIGEANFLGDFHCASKTKHFDALGTNFHGEFSFSASIRYLARFNGCRFHNSVHFFGSQGSVFGGRSDADFEVAGFENVIFWKPESTLFQDVNLQNASFKSTALIGVRFNNSNFYQTYLKRNGIYRDVKELQRKSRDKVSEPDKHRYDSITNEYRQLRMAMEGNKDYVIAHDFYVGEMESRQRRESSWVLILYKISSLYGTNYVRALKVIGLLFLLHFGLTLLLSTNLNLLRLCCVPNLVAGWERLADIMLHTLSTCTLQRTGLLSNVSFPQGTVDIVFRVLIPIQTAMAVLALRNKTKR